MTINSCRAAHKVSIPFARSHLGSFRETFPEALLPVLKNPFHIASARQPKLGVEDEFIPSGMYLRHWATISG
jgi:hypothetical protein